MGRFSQPVNLILFFFAGHRFNDVIIYSGGTFSPLTHQSFFIKIISTHTASLPSLPVLTFALYLSNWLPCVSIRSRSRPLGERAITWPLTLHLTARLSPLVLTPSNRALHPPTRILRLLALPPPAQISPQRLMLMLIALLASFWSARCHLSNLLTKDPTQSMLMLKPVQM